MSIYQKLKQKGWNEQELINLAKIFEEKQTKTSITYWIALIASITINVFTCVAIVPLLLALTGTYLTIMLSIMGLTFGYLLSYVLTRMETAKTKHVIAGILIPAIALISVYIITYLSNYIGEIAKLKIHSPATISAIYTTSFILPYLIYKVKTDYLPQ